MLNFNCIFKYYYINHNHRGMNQCTLSNSVFLVFLLGIVHRKLISEEKEHDCLDLKIELTIVCSTKQLKFGYSLGLAWIATLFTTLCCVCWFQITKMQKLLFTNGYY